MNEPKYTKSEQKKRMKDFEHHVKLARKAWRKGQAYVIMSFREYLHLISKRGEI